MISSGGSDSADFPGSGLRFGNEKPASGSLRSHPGLSARHQAGQYLDKHLIVTHNFPLIHMRISYPVSGPFLHSLLRIRLAKGE